MARTLTAGVDYAPPQSQRATKVPSREPSPINGDRWRSIHGQALEWALDRCSIEQKAAAYRMGYSDPGVVSRWIYGTERMQLDKLRMLGEVFFAELLVALAQTCEGVEVRTQVTLARRA